MGLPSSDALAGKTIERRLSPSDPNPSETAAIVVQLHSLLNIRGVTDIEALIGTADNVDRKVICWPRCGHGKSPFYSLRSLRAFDLLLVADHRCPSRIEAPHFRHWPAMSERSESNGASGTPVKLFMAGLRIWKPNSTAEFAMF